MTVGIDLALLKESESASDVQSYITDLASKLRLTQDVIEQNMKDRAVRSKVFYDNDTKKPQITVGFKVLRYDTRCYFNVRSKADISQLNLPHLIYCAAML